MCSIRVFHCVGTLLYVGSAIGVSTNSELDFWIGLGNISMNRKYREPMMRNNQYRKFFEEAIILHLQYITVIYNTYITILQYCNVTQHDLHH